MKVGDLVKVKQGRLSRRLAPAETSGVVVGIDENFYMHSRSNTSPRCDRLEILWTDGSISKEPEPLVEVIQC